MGLIDRVREEYEGFREGYFEARRGYSEARSLINVIKVSIAEVSQGLEESAIKIPIALFVIEGEKLENPWYEIGGEIYLRTHKKDRKLLDVVREELRKKYSSRTEE